MGLELLLWCTALQQHRQSLSVLLLYSEVRDLSTVTMHLYSCAHTHTKRSERFSLGTSLERFAASSLTSRRLFISSHLIWRRRACWPHARRVDSVNWLSILADQKQASASLRASPKLVISFVVHAQVYDRKFSHRSSLAELKSDTNQLRQG